MFRLKRHFTIVFNAAGSDEKVDKKKTEAEDNVEVLDVSEDAIESVRPCRRMFGPVGNQEMQVMPDYMTLHLHGGEELIVSQVTADALVQAIGVQSLPFRKRT